MTEQISSERLTYLVTAWNSARPTEIARAFQELAALRAERDVLLKWMTENLTVEEINEVTGLILADRAPAAKETP